MKTINCNNQPGVLDGDNGHIKSKAKGWQLSGIVLSPTDNNRSAVETKVPSCKQQHSYTGLMGTLL